MITFNPSYNNTNFKSFRHEILNKSGRVINRGDTCLFRHDLDFDYLINFLEFKYCDTSKVNIIAHACSVGEEVYSLVSKIIESLGDKAAKKYLPIEAKDIEQEHIDLAKKGRYIIKSYERGAIDYYLGDKFNDYFYLLSNNNIKVAPRIKNEVNFSQSDILEDCKNINFDNTVLLARNFWHYLDDEDIDKLAMNLSYRMNKSSTLVIGDYDKQYNIDEILRRYGFFETQVKNVFEKIK